MGRRSITQYFVWWCDTHEIIIDPLLGDLVEYSDSILTARPRRMTLNIEEEAVNNRLVDKIEFSDYK